MTEAAGQRGRRSRDTSRRKAFQALYEASLRSTQPEAPEDPFAAKLVADVGSSFGDLVALIEPRLKSGWTFDRLSLTEQLILVLAAAELVGSDRATPGVVAAWTHLADLYGEPSSVRFINGLLASLASARSS